MIIYGLFVDLKQFLNESAWLATIGALGAWLVSWQEARRNNSVRLRMREFKWSVHHDELGTRSELRVIVRNCGVQLQNVVGQLSFRGLESGSFQIAMPLSDRSSPLGGSFLRGSWAEFVLTVNEPDDFLASAVLTDLKKQQPYFRVFATGFLVHEHAICRRIDWLRTRWNAFAAKVQVLYRKSDGFEGKGVYRFVQVPAVPYPAAQLESFLRYHREKLQPQSAVRQKQKSPR